MKLKQFYPAYDKYFIQEGNPVERVMREMGRLGRTYCNYSHTSWCHQLRTFEKWINKVTHESTGLPPNIIQHTQTKQRV